MGVTFGNCVFDVVKLEELVSTHEFFGAQFELGLVEVSVHRLSTALALQRLFAIHGLVIHWEADREFVVGLRHIQHDVHASLEFRKQHRELDCEGTLVN